MNIPRLLFCAFVALLGSGLCRSQAANSACDSSTCVNLVFDGDSISAGAGASPGHALDPLLTAAFGPNVRSHNVAVGGRPVIECLNLFPQLVMPLFDRATRANVIVFHAGDNDVARGHNAAETYAAFTTYVAAAHRQGWKVVVSTELLRPGWHPPMSTELEQYNVELRRNRAGADAVVDLDSDPRLREMSYRRDPALFTSDGVHPSDGGYAVLAGLVLPAVRRVAGR